MPHVLDLVDDQLKTLEGANYALSMELLAAKKRSKEIRNHDPDLLKEDAKAHLAEQESICDDLNKALTDATARQRKFNDTRRKWFDSKL